MTDQATEFVHHIFGKDKTFYEILGVEKTANDDEIKRAYRKLALVYHPDREGGDTEKFKALSIVHSILANSNKRSIYDSTGEVDTEESSDGFADWSEYFRALFPKITITMIDTFASNYKGSDEERGDLKDAFNRFKGNMENVMKVVLFAEVGEEERLCATIDDLIANNELQSTKAYEKFKAKFAGSGGKTKRTSKKKAHGGASEEDLAALILANNNNKRSAESAFGAIFAKYGGEKGSAAALGDDVDDEEFMATQKRLMKGKGKK